MSTNDRSYALQVVGSLIVAALIVWITVAVVASQLPLRYLPEEQSEELQEEAEERREERQERIEERREEKAED